jgi:regulator of protease activity HflC (stomatin/prohibitin superfamily)
MYLNTEIAVGLLVIGLVILIWYIKSKVIFVPEGMMMITVRFGRFAAVYKSGLAILTPFENPMAIDKPPYDGEGIVVENKFLPSRFKFDPDSVNVCSKRSTVVNVDPVLMLGIVDMQKLYFAYPSEDPFSLLVGKIEDMLNETCRTYDTITREHFKEIGSKTRGLLAEFCKTIGITIESFELQNMQLSEERMSLEAEAENKNRSLLLEREQMRIEHESQMGRIENQEKCRLRKIASKQAEESARLQAELENAKKRNEIAAVEAESQLAFTKMLESNKLSELYFRQSQVTAQTELSKSILAGSHVTYVMDHNKLFYQPFVSTPSSSQ